MSRARRTRGFTLMEVVLALGVFSFAILALMALLGPLLSGMREGRDQARTAQLIALTDTWLRRAAASNFEAVRNRLGPGADDLDLYLYAWEAPSGGVRWQVGDREAWLIAHARFRAGAGAYRSSLYRVSLRHDPSLQPAHLSTDWFRALRAEIASVAVGDPSRSAEAIDKALAAAFPQETFFTTFRR